MMRDWRRAWWGRALETGDTLVSRVVRLWSAGRRDTALALANRLGLCEDVEAWPEVRGPNPCLPHPQVGRWVVCDLCEGRGAVVPSWAWRAADPGEFSEDCPDCRGRGGWMEDPAGGEEDIWGAVVYGSNDYRPWVAAYREARRNGASPEEARAKADAAVEEPLGFDPEAPLPF